MARLGLVARNETYAPFPPGVGGSHVPDADRQTIALCTSGGIKALGIIVMPAAGVLDTHREDIRKARQEWGVEDLYLRVATWGADPDPVWLGGSVAPLVTYALQWFPRLTVLFVNEFRIDYKEMDAARAVATTKQAGAYLKGTVGSLAARVRISSPTVNAYAEQSERDLAEILATPDAYDVLGANVYPHNAGELSGRWSLPWWLAMAPKGKPVVVWEYNGHPTQYDDQGKVTFRLTPEERTALLPPLHAQMLDSAADAALWFLVSTGDAKLLEMATNSRQVADALAVAQGWRPDATETPPPTQVLAPPVGPYDPQALWDWGAKLSGGPGWNESLAFAGWAKMHPEAGPFGFPLADTTGYDQGWPFLVLPMSCGLFVYEKATAKIKFARTAEEAANPFV